MSVQIYYCLPALPLHSIHIYLDLQSSAHPTPRLSTILSTPHPNPLWWAYDPPTPSTLDRIGSLYHFIL